MKDGKPEVLIIGEEHPQSMILFKLPKKKINFKFSEQYSGKIFVPDIEASRPDKIIEVGRDVSALIDAEVSIIKEFGGHRVLYEYPYTPLSNRAAELLKKNSDLRQFQKLMRILDANYNKTFSKELKSILTFSKGDIPTTLHYKWLSFIVGMTKVYDINFFDDEKYSLNESIYFTLLNYIDANPQIHLLPKEAIERSRALNNTKREEKIITNIKKHLVDKTVIICGSFHAKNIARGLKNVAHINELVLVGHF